uniref:Uncharacterized protein n=1 Tax=Salix viminalis TaxID=40686 RepID=A0A6N2LHY7_SALVM
MMGEVRGRPSPRLSSCIKASNSTLFSSSSLAIATSFSSFALLLPCFRFFYFFSVQDLRSFFLSRAWLSITQYIIYIYIHNLSKNNHSRILLNQL